MNTHHEFKQILDRVTILAASARRKLAPHRVGDELDVIKRLVQALADEFDGVHYYNVEVSHGDIAPEISHPYVLLPEWQATLLLAAESKLTYMRTQAEQSAKILLVYQLEEMYRGILGRDVHLQPRHARLLSVVTDE